MTDQQRFDQLGYSSNGFFETPNLDRLARQGVIFDNAYSACTTCAPARASALTGLYPHRYAKATGPGFPPLQEGCWTIAHALRQAGYQTGLFGKTHFTPFHANHGFDVMRTIEHMNMYTPETIDDYLRWLLWQGKADPRATHLDGGGWGQRTDEFRKCHCAEVFPFEAKYHPTNWTAMETIKFIEKRDPAKPYMAWVTFAHPHAPFDPPEPYASRYNIDEMPAPETTMEINDNLPPVAKGLMQGSQPYGYVPVAKNSPEVIRKIRTYIRALVNQIDDAVGEILEHVNLEDTVVFFTSDHGDFYGNRGLMLKTPFFPLDDIAKVPFFCAGAGIPQGKRVANCIEVPDYVPTCLDLAGLPKDVAMDAVSLMPHFREGAVADDRIVYTFSNSNYPMVRKKQIKYFRHQDSGEELLFDLEKDPLETANCINDPAYAARAEELRVHLMELLARGIPDVPRFGGSTPWRDGAIGQKGDSRLPWQVVLGDRDQEQAQAG